MIIVCRFPGVFDHASLAVIPKNGTAIYISFFPSNTQPFHLHTYQSDAKQHHIGQAVIIPSEEECGFGLSESKIIDWWRKIPLAKESFAFFGNNCAVMVWRALQAGSPTKLIDKNFSTPSGLLKAAEQIRDGYVNPIERNGELKSTRETLELMLHLDLDQLDLDLMIMLISKLEHLADIAVMQHLAAVEKVINVSFGVADKFEWHDALLKKIVKKDLSLPTPHLKQALEQLVAELREPSSVAAIRQKMADTHFNQRIHEKFYSSSQLTRSDIPTRSM